jgi:hypothetical protein
MKRLGLVLLCVLLWPATEAGRMSTRDDRGTAARTMLFEWRCTMTLTGTNLWGAVVEENTATDSSCTLTPWSWESQ